MTKTENTPWAWECGPVYQHPKTGLWHCDVISNGLVIAKVQGITKQECEVRGRFIATAPALPDLLAELKRARGALISVFGATPEGETIQRIDAAIAKAEGK